MDQPKVNIKNEQEENLQQNDCDENKRQLAETSQRILIINPRSLNSSTSFNSCSSSSSVITLHDARFLDVRKSLLLRKALVKDPQQDVVVACRAPITTSTTATDVANSCIRAYASAVNDCEPD